MTESDFKATREIMRRLRGFREASILISFAELGVGDALADGTRTAEEVAAMIKADAAATARFLRGAAAIGLVEEEGERFRNSALASATLTSGNATSLVHFVSREAAFYRRWGNLTEAVRSGQRPEANRRDEETPGWVRDFVLALGDTARIAAPGITAALTPIIEAFGRPVSVIDVGGCHAAYSLDLAKRFPDLRAVVFDLPPVIEVTRGIVAASGLSERVEARAGDFHVDRLGGQYDLALLFGVLVGEDTEGSVRLLQDVRAALRPGGMIAVRTHGAEGNKADPLEGAIADLHMLLSTHAGGVRGQDRTRGWMRDAGLAPIEEIAIPAPGTGSLMIGHVPD